jgi:hypothetical protein
MHQLPPSQGVSRFLLILLIRITFSTDREDMKVCAPFIKAIASMDKSQVFCIAHCSKARMECQICIDRQFQMAIATTLFMIIREGFMRI